MLKLPKSNLWKVLLLCLLVGFIVRVGLVSYNETSGDILAFAEWGKRFWELGAKNFYSEETWYYSFPTYPPISSLMYGGAFWLFDHKHLLALLHNYIKIPPSNFIIYFYKHGYFLLLKLPAILSDLGISLIIYKIIWELTKSREKSLVGFAFYLFNPLTIFLSGVWGQTESLVAFFGLLSFLLVFYNKVFLSIPFFFISLYIKPTWAIFIPLYVVLLWTNKPKTNELLLGILLSLLVFLATTLPFSSKNVLFFLKDIVFTHILPSAKGGGRASISAFNFYTIFIPIDKTLEKAPILGVPANLISNFAFIVINVIAFNFIRGSKDKLLGIVVSIFIVGFGSFLFLTNMLERYFFSAFAPMVVLIVTRPKTFIYLLLINLVLFSNLIYSFYRRRYDEVDHPFTNNNFFLIKVLSLVNTISFVGAVRRLLKGTREATI